MVFIQFLFSSAIIVVAAIKLAEYGDIISIRTGIGGMFIGLILMAGATSLPELLTTFNSIQQNVPNLAAGNIFGSSMFNMLLLGMVDLVNWRARVLRKVARTHALSASIAALLIALSVFFVLADIPVTIGWIGLDSLILILAYFFGMSIIRTSTPTPPPTEPEEYENIPSLKHALIGFGIATLALVLVMPLLVSSSKVIAQTTGLGTGFVGTALVAFITSLPELITSVAAIRMGVFDLAIGNLFGSNMFNVFSLGISDIFLLNGRFIGAISPDFVIVGIIGLILTLFGLIGNLAKLEKRFLMLEIDAMLLILGYFAGLWLIFLKGIGI